MLGESKRGQQNQSTVPSVLTSAAVCRSPIRPWSLIAGYLSIAPSFHTSMWLLDAPVSCKAAPNVEPQCPTRPSMPQHVSPGPKSVQLIVSLADETVARFRHLVPGPGKFDYRLRDDDPRLVGYLLQARALRVHLPQRAHVGAVVKRARLALARVPERPHRSEEH